MIMEGGISKLKARMLIKAGQYAPSIQTIVDLEKRVIIKPNVPEDFFYISKEFPLYNILIETKQRDDNELINDHVDLFVFYKEMLNKKAVYRAIIAKSFSQIWKFTTNCVFYQKWGFSRFGSGQDADIFQGMLFDKTVTIGLCRNTRVVEDLGGYTGLLYAFQEEEDSIVITPNGLLNLGRVDKVDLSIMRYNEFAKLPENVYGMYIKDGKLKYIEL